jgi:hypothetical protein
LIVGVVAAGADAVGIMVVAVILGLMITSTIHFVSIVTVAVVTLGVILGKLIAGAGDRLIPPLLIPRVGCTDCGAVFSTPVLFPCPIVTVL